MSNNAENSCIANIECNLITNEEDESAGQDKTVPYNSDIGNDKIKPDIEFEMDNKGYCSFPMNKVFLQELNEEQTDSSFLNSTLSAIQVGKSWKFPANLTLVHFCVDFDKVFAMCHKHYTPEEQKCISLYEFDASSGKLEKIMPLFYHNTVVVDMCIAKIRHNQCITIGHTQVTKNDSNVGYWYIKFLNIAGCEIYTIGLEKCSLGPICSFENKLLLYHSQNTCILVFDTSKWPIERNETYFETGLGIDRDVLHMITCPGEAPDQRLVIIDYISIDEIGLQCFDMTGIKLWNISQRDTSTAYYPCADNKGHVFICEFWSGKVFLLQDNLRLRILFDLSGEVDLYSWSNTANKMFIAHCTDKMGSQAVQSMSCYDIIE